MTLERAAELVSALREEGQREACYDLFAHFDDYFKLSNDKTGIKLQQFAEMCGFAIATNIRIV